VIGGATAVGVLDGDDARVSAVVGALDGADIVDTLPHATSTSDRPRRPRWLRTLVFRDTDR
jgi:hypothetical protein